MRSQITWWGDIYNSSRGPVTRSRVGVWHVIPYLIGIVVPGAELKKTGLLIERVVSRPELTIRLQ